MITVADLAFGYGPGSFQLRVPRLAIAAGEKVACVGRSGSGKTTLLHLLAGIETASSGSVRVADTELTSLSDRERRAFRLARIGLLFQELELLDYLSALDNVLLPFHLGAKAAADPAAAARQLAAALGIEALLRRRPAQLSQGERQRVALCRALVTEPGILLCDEPTGNLDPDSARSVLDLLFEAVDTRGTTLFLVTHDHALLGRFDRVIDMRTLGGAA